MDGMIARLAQGLSSRLRAAILRRRGMRFDGKCWLRKIEVPRHAGMIRLGADVALDRDVVLLITGGNSAEPKLVIGRQTYVNRHTFFDVAESIVIGPQCMIGPFCYITDHDHTADETGSHSAGPLRCAPTRIEAQCWLGAHVTILKGVTVGAGSIIGAGSVVTRSIPPGVVAAGNPARVLRPLAETAGISVLAK